jgi:hypothetical protein
MTHGSPTDAYLAGNWGILFDVRFADLVNLPRLPHTTGFRPSGRFREALEWTTTTNAAQGGPIVPLVSIPRAITLNGAGFYVGASGIGTTPTLSWSAGPVGQPAFYRIVVSQLFVDGTLTAGRTVAQILTPNTTFTFPPGILNSGSVYVFRLTPFVSTSAQGAALLASSPFKSGLDIAFATTVSGEFVP